MWSINNSQFTESSRNGSLELVKMRVGGNWPIESSDAKYGEAMGWVLGNSPSGGT
jgi:hypothetical protein